jgi:hypothetical protein
VAYTQDVLAVVNDFHFRFSTEVSSFSLFRRTHQSAFCNLQSEIRISNLFIQPVDLESLIIITQPVQTIRFYQGRLVRQEPSAAQLIEQTSNDSPMGDHQDTIAPHLLSNIHQCLPTTLQNFQTTFSVKGSKVPAQFLLYFELISVKEVTEFTA